MSDSFKISNDFETLGLELDKEFKKVQEEADEELFATPVDYSVDQEIYSHLEVFDWVGVWIGVDA